MPAKRPTIEDFKARWADFRTECANLDYARCLAFRGYGNEDVGADDGELWDRVYAVEDRYAHEPVWKRADALMGSYYRRAGM